MSSLEDHMKLCQEIMGKPMKEAHLWIDQHFKTHSWRHRKLLHHEEGIKYAREKFGDEFAKAVEIHIRQDCGHLPRRDDYESGKVDEMGYILPPSKQNKVLCFNCRLDNCSRDKPSAHCDCSSNCHE